MSQELINHSPDLRKLRDDGYEVEVRYNYLVMRNIPYVNATRQIRRGILVSTLNLAGNVTQRPDTHVAMFSGEHPCHKDGSPIAQIQHSSCDQKLGDDLVVNHSFSNKPLDGYSDYYEKMSTYATIISGPAEALDSSVTARTFRVIEPELDRSVFNYLDTASSRAGINSASRKLELRKIAIVGLGGTGSYVLDLVAKTPVREIHIFDRDKFLTHNAFRAPGAPSLEELRKVPAKVAYLADRYSRMHRHIIPHDCDISEFNIGDLKDMDFVFLCLDSGGSKKFIVRKLDEFDVPFVDVGIGVLLVGDALCGIVRTTASTSNKRNHVYTAHRIPFPEYEVENEYSKNIQIADLNALNAALAVIKWKKMFGFYYDFEREHHSTYTIDGNHLSNAEQA